MKIPLAKPVFDVEMGVAALDALWGERWVLGPARIERWDSSSFEAC